MSHELVVFVTTTDNEEAASIAEALVSERLAACVNILGPVESVYRWEGKITRDREALMIIKTTDQRYPDLELRVKALHSYTTPEVLAFRIEQGSADYLTWIRDSTAAEKTGR
ncbi:MAG: divalent-cation tolerance protein CutA [Acidobacteria bacterium]|nr:MAG: divalent-cation tolerance protein CutA [Acidobacteriota bacterium]